MQLQKSENQHTEYKQSWKDDYLKWVCAFANTDGGVLYVGVDDSGMVCGIANSKRLCEDIPNKILHTMGLICAVNLYEDEGKDYLQIVVEKYPFPVSYHGKYYKRSGSTTQEVNGFELDKMILGVQGRTWDSVPVPYVKVEDLDETAFKIFKRKALQRHRLNEEDLAVSREDLLQNLHCYENQYLTRAAVLAFHPDPEKWFTCSFIKIAYFENDADILYQDEVHGSLLEQVERSMEIIYTKYMKALISYEGITRRETYFFPPEAFRELLLNAVIHKDYMQPTPIQIQVFRDKINIWNYGSMPPDLTLEDLFKAHRSVPRNPNIANIFFRCGYVEAWGRGYNKIMRLCDEWQSKAPVPEVNTGGLLVECVASESYLKLAKELKVDGLEDDTVNNNKLPKDFPKTSQRLPKDCPIAAQKTYLAIEDNPYATLSELSDKVGVSERSIKNHIALLKEAGLIVRIGSRTIGYWKIVEKE